ncbi:MAG: nitroreductase family protein [Bacteroidales bacterium]|jgi:nitroreductase/NAD-dependent dihydropyrimidine dehydrogenase PreA subunit|nr:nitroreductase family protein [Bacteroidales bacterium]
MINFKVDQAKCIKCKLCISECPVLIINGRTEFPEIKENKEEACIKCQHCLAVCPTAAITIWGKHPEDSTLVNDEAIPSAEAMEQLYKTRRSIRKFKNEELDKTLINNLLEVAAHAPTAKNENAVLYTVIDNKKDLAAFRSLTYDYIKEAVSNETLPKHLVHLGNFQAVWESKGFDVLFRNAPHLLITSAPKSATSPQTDCTIAMSYFELLANANGVGTLWNGFAQTAIRQVSPEISKKIGIPEDHEIVNVMIFGTPAVKFTRGIQSNGLNLNRVSL